MVAISLSSLLTLAALSIQCQWKNCLNNNKCLRLETGGDPRGTEFCVCSASFYGEHCEFDSRSQFVPMNSEKQSQPVQTEVISPDVDADVHTARDNHHVKK